MTILSFFHLNPHHLRPGPYHVTGLRQRLGYMGVKHIEIAALLTDEIPWFVANGYRAILIGDGVMRTLPDRRHCTEENITRAARLWGESGICDGIEMVDEAKQDPGHYMPHAANFVKWWRSACSIPIAWPSLMPHAWEKPGLSDYDSPQWRWDTPGITGKEQVDRLKRSLADYPRNPRDLCAMPVLSFHYEKLSHGDRYNKRKDKLVTSIPTEENFERQCRAALDAGARRLRIYDWDPEYRRDERALAPLGTRLQQGISLADKRWPGVEMVVKELVAGNR